MKTILKIFRVFNVLIKKIIFSETLTWLFHYHRRTFCMHCGRLITNIRYNSKDYNTLKDRGIKVPICPLCVGEKGIAVKADLIVESFVLPPDVLSSENKENKNISNNNLLFHEVPSTDDS